MATLLLGAAGSLVGGAFFGPLGAVAGRALGALGGSMVDGALLGGSRSNVVQGARLSDLDVMTSSAGAPVPRIYGRVRLAGQVIWATSLEEVVSSQAQSSGGKSSRSQKVTTTTISYSYFANFALGLCEGEVTRIGRIWADGKPLDTSGLTLRTYRGSADQPPDPWIEAKQGAGNTPAYRGLAYLVFERLPLAKFGNRVPQITVEVERAVGRLEPLVKAITLIPGATEFGYAPQQVQRVLGRGAYGAENRHVTGAESDFEASLDQLQAACPNLERVSLVVTWFGDDLRAGVCTVRPKVERAVKDTIPYAWTVGWMPRLLAPIVSGHDGRPAYGGTPADASVIAAIQALTARGLKVTLNPFVMMDIAPGNGRPDPWTGDASQPAYPWRGRITCDPAPGRPGSPDGTSDAGAQVTALFGQAQPSHFSNYFGGVLYGGPAEWSLRRMVLHYAFLAQMAGGVESFLIGSELAALTRVRGAAGGSPAARALRTLAQDVKAMLGADTKVSYGADWTEYGAQTFEGGEVRFPLDTLWASPDVDFVGIDYYPPLADWRDGRAHLDAALADGPYDLAYLAANVRRGEAFDWYYADAAARAAQARTPITDGAYGEPWIYRQKDLWSFWANAHHERPGGVRAAASTEWVPGSKPFRLTEIGCPAVDKGANRPSSFPDAKSVEGGLPPFSNGARDDLMQRRTLEAVLGAFDPAAGASAADNPPAPAYGGRMVEEGGLFLWTWDARPYPQFPLARDVWADGVNWETGHWLTGRLGAAPLASVIAEVCADHGVEAVSATGVLGVVSGFIVDRPMSARSALEPLARAFGFEAREEGGTLAFRPRGGAVAARIDVGDLVPGEEGATLSLVRAQESELPLEVGLSFIDAGSDYRTASVSSRRLVGASRHVAQTEIAVVASDAVMVRAADIWLQDLWAGRESATFTLPPSRIALAPGDVVEIVGGARTWLLEITRIEDAEARTVTARSIEPEVFDTPLQSAASGSVSLPQAYGPPAVQVLDLPWVTAADPVSLQWLAASAAPWPGTLAVWRSTDGASFEAIAAFSAPCTAGETLDDLPPGPCWRFDRSTVLRVRLDGGLLLGASEGQVLEGANALALLAEGRAPEILQFTQAELLESSLFALSGLLRGQAGTEASGAAPWPSGTRFVLLDGNVATVASGVSAYGRTYVYRVGRADRDHGDAFVTEVTGQVGGAALKPYAPVHLSARRVGDHIALAWVRRTRSDGDGWEAVDVPLGEAVEAYRLEILSGAAVVRAVEVGAPAFTYGASEELADFGAPQTALTFRVAQLSAVLGAGAFAQATLAV
ncbi:glycoside hydrolase/phage tail family protein [Xanthobacter sp. DSM 24535]|uniref:baseplate multidomain protein megatron n=1 Tax=Roseixanthobacter psychrophilus TaxID=3119917 RepID=UPI00372C0515